MTHFLKYFYRDLNSDFSDIESSIRNCMENFDFFVTTFLLSENAATSGGRLANLKKSQINHPYYTQIILILNFFCNVFLT